MSAGAKPWSDVKIAKGGTVVELPEPERPWPTRPVRPLSAPPRPIAIPGYTGHAAGQRNAVYGLRFEAAEQARRAERRGNSAHLHSLLQIEVPEPDPKHRHEYRLFEPIRVSMDCVTQLPRASVPRSASARERTKRIFQAQRLHDMPLNAESRRQLFLFDQWKDHAYPSFKQPTRPNQGTKPAGHPVHTSLGLRCHDGIREFQHPFTVAPSRLDLRELPLLQQSMCPGGLGQFYSG